jgi:carboxylate/amino acid/amine transporter
MVYLIGVTVLWAFSFSLIGVYLAGQVDAYFAVLVRVILASALFFPLIRWRQTPKRMAFSMMALGAIQLGVMYLCFYQSFLLLSVPEILLFTIFTPIYITVLYDILHRRFSLWYLITAGLAVIGAAVIRYQNISADFVLGFLLVQAANLCFAVGQVGYKVVLERSATTTGQAVRHQDVFGFFYLGALAVAVLAWFALGNPEKLPSTVTHWGVLLWLGLGASGLGYFFWNKGACLVDAGALAIMNNALIPAGLIVNIVIWNKDAPIERLALGGAIIVGSLLFNELWVRPRQRFVAG